jgi:hypothetical protein
MRPAARRHSILAAVAIAAATALSGLRGEAHKPITSPFTFTEDVFPILRDRCGRCHVAGGVAPMSLMTHQETVPWGESIRLELIAGHMPPWSAETSVGRFRNGARLSARELNTLLTWASGGTPPGDDAKAPPAIAATAAWSLGEPDREIALPEFTLNAEAQEQLAEFVVPVGESPDVRPATERWLRAIDLRPGTPAIVRSATIEVRPSSNTRSPVLLRWQPGDDPVSLEDAAFRLPAGAELVVRVQYKKTWEYERKVMLDRSSIGLYFATGTPPEVRALTVTPPGLMLEENVRLLAVSPDPALVNTDVRVEAARPDGSRATLIAFRPTAGWARRYWFEEPVTLPRGTRVSISAGSVSLDVVASR